MSDPDIETLWCDSYVDNRLGWAVTGSSPYLDDTDGSYIYSKVDAADEGDYGFADLSFAGSITSVTLYLECYADDAPNDDNFDVYVYDGSSWTNEGNIAPSTTGWGTFEPLVLSTKLDTDTKVNDAQVYFIYHKSKAADEVWTRRAYLYVDYTPTPSGQEYTRDVSQSISMAGSSYRLFTLSRDFTQGLMLSSQTYRTWDTSRTLTQSATLATTSYRHWGLLRTLTQSITLSSGTFTTHFEYFLRSLTQGLNLATNAFRSWSLSRTNSQGTTFTANSLRTWSLSRALTQGVSFLSNTFAKITQGAEQFYRTLTMGISFTNNALRSWGLSRIATQQFTITNLASRTWVLSRAFTQGLSFLSNAFGTVSQMGVQFFRTVTLGINLATDSLRSWDLSRSVGQGIMFTSNAIGVNLGTVLRGFATLVLNVGIQIAVFTTIVNEFNLPLLLLQLTTFAFTGLFILRDRDIGWGSIATMLWFLTAFATIRNNVNDYPIAGFYTILGVIFGVYVLYETGMMLKNQGDYWV